MFGLKPLMYTFIDEVLQKSTPPLPQSFEVVHKPNYDNTIYLIFIIFFKQYIYIMLFKSISRYLLTLALITLCLVSCKQQAEEVKPQASLATNSATEKGAMSQEELAAFFQDESVTALKNALMENIPAGLKEQLGNVELLDETLPELQIAFAQQLLDQKLLQNMNTQIQAVNKKYGRKLGTVNKQSVKENLKRSKVALRQAKSARFSRSECRKITTREINKRKGIFTNKLKACLRIVGGNYWGTSDRNRRLFDMALFRHSIEARAIIGYNILHRGTDCNGYQLGIDPVDIIITIGFFAAAERSLRDVGKKFNLNVHFTNRKSVYNIAFRPVNAKGMNMRASTKPSKNRRAVVAKGTRNAKMHIRWRTGKKGEVIIENDHYKHYLNAGTNPTRFSGLRSAENHPDLRWFIEPGSSNYTIRLYSKHKRKSLRYIPGKDGGSFRMSQGEGSGSSFKVVGL